MKRVHYHFNVVLRPEPEGGFTALVPALPGCADEETLVTSLDLEYAQTAHR
jgi:hypothetical protein